MSDATLIGEYLPVSLADVFIDVVKGPDDDFKPPEWLIKAIDEVAHTSAPPLKAPPVKFAVDDDSLEHNGQLLDKFNFDLTELLDHFADTTLGYGSEFRPVDQLEKIFAGHPNFAFFRNVLQQGMKYFFHQDISEEQRVAKLEANLKRGNHKSATSEPQQTAKALHKDVKFGFSLPFPSKLVRRLKGALVQPCGLAYQFSLKSDGTRERKHRLTHDLSFEATGEGRSVNSRIDMSKYPEMIFGWCLPRIIHFIVALRTCYPGVRIFIAKYDFSDAYRRVAHSASAASQSIIVLASVAFLALRLSFGGAPNPPTWCSFSEMVTDLSNEIPLCEDWDPSKLHSPGQPQTPTPKTLGDSVPFAIGRQLAVTVPTEVTGRTDSFIDDLIRVFLDTPDNREKQPHAVPLAIFVANRPNAGNDEPVPRRENLSAPKLVAEGTPAEIQIVLGWDLDTRRLLVRLPQDKFIAWSSDLSDCIQAGRITLGELETLVGRLNHAAYVIPLSHHFLGRLRQRLQLVRNSKQHIRFSKDEIEDLILWLTFLLTAREGIPMNLLTLRTPSRLGISDSCPYGLGGFSWSGRAWRIQIPQQSCLYGVSEANNVLEFLAMAITIWLIVQECNELSIRDECILSLGDNTSAVGWLFRSSRLPPESPYYGPVQLIARKVALLITQSGQCLCSQHIKGSSNHVADWLSFTHQTRDGKLNPLAHDSPSDEQLTHRFHSFTPQLIPLSFEISPLPDEILSFAELVLQTAESSSTRYNQRRTKTRTAPGVAGVASVPKRESWTRSSLVYQSTSANSSSVPSFVPTEPLGGISQESFLQQIRKPWLARLSALPQAIWLRRFGTVSNQAPYTSKTAPGSSLPLRPC
jgi:hypothetical protein